MISKEEAQSQVDRFASLDWFVTTEHRSLALDELNFAMQTAADLTTAILITDEWIRYHTEYPKPAEIRRLLWEEKEKGNYGSLPESIVPTCRTCNDTGWELVERGGLTGVKPCHCRKAVSA